MRQDGACWAVIRRAGSSRSVVVRTNHDYMGLGQSHVFRSRFHLFPMGDAAIARRLDR